MLKELHVSMMMSPYGTACGATAHSFGAVVGAHSSDQRKYPVVLYDNSKHAIVHHIKCISQKKPNDGCVLCPQFQK